MTSGSDQLKFAIESFLAGQSDDLVSSSRIVNQLLALWATAHEIGPEVAAPLESLLSAVPNRSLIASAELRSILAEVLAAAERAPEPTQVG